MRCLLFVLSSMIVTSCGVGTHPTQSKLGDIYVADQGDGTVGSYRRHPASTLELSWTVSMNGCTGHLIGPRHMMTANHCSPQAGSTYTSGAALAAGRRNDLRVKRVAESDRDLDYAILELEWIGAYPATQRFPGSVPVRREDAVTSIEADQGDEVFTVGFPADKSSWGATSSRGQLKGIEDGHIYYNMGIINGNSGGGVWRVRDHMLVSLTNNGPRAFGQPGWDKAEINSRSLKDHNHGTAMWEIYRDSSLLKELFPGGKSASYAQYAPGWRRPPHVIPCSCGRTRAGRCGLVKEGHWVGTTVTAPGQGSCDGTFCQKQQWPSLVRECAGEVAVDELAVELSVAM